MRTAPGEQYHIYNRGMHKHVIFADDNDRLRFLFLLLINQNARVSHDNDRLYRKCAQHSMLGIPNEIVQKIVKNRSVALVCFCLMPNHFHAIVYEIENGGIAKYMQRVLNAYTKYYNTRHSKSGHIFQGKYQDVYIEDDAQLLYLSAYIHKNPIESGKWKNILHLYPWSSYSDYISQNRWGALLVPDSIIDRYTDKMHYQAFVTTSIAKI